MPTFLINGGGHFYAIERQVKLKMESKPESKQEPRAARIWIIAVLIAILVIALAAYYYTFHRHKQQRPVVAPSATIIALRSK